MLVSLLYPFHACTPVILRARTIMCNISCKDLNHKSCIFKSCIHVLQRAKLKSLRIKKLVQLMQKKVYKDKSTEGGRSVSYWISCRYIVVLRKVSSKSVQNNLPDTCVLTHWQAYKLTNQSVVVASRLKIQNWYFSLLQSRKKYHHQL